MTILAYLNCLNIVKKKHADICRKTFANIRKNYYLCISKPTKPLTRALKPPRHLRWLTPPLMEGSEWPWLLKAPPPRHLRWLAPPLNSGIVFFTFRFSLFPYIGASPFLPFYLFTFKNAFLPLKITFKCLSQTS